MQEIQVNEITKLTPTKTNVLVVANEMTEPILNGEVDAIEFIVRCQFAIDCLSQAMKTTKDYSLNSLKQSTTILGAKVEIAETGTKYDYSSNEIWKSILQGDEIIASPVTKESTTSIKITLGK